MESSAFIISAAALLSGRSLCVWAKMHEMGVMSALMSNAGVWPIIMPSFRGSSLVFLTSFLNFADRV